MMEFVALAGATLATYLAIIPRMVRQSRAAMEFMLSILALAVGFHWFGSSLKFTLDAMTFHKTDSPAYTPALDLGMAWVAVLLLILHHTRTKNRHIEPVTSWQASTGIGLSMAVFALLYAFAVGAINWEPSLIAPLSLMAWLVTQLVTVTAEEAFFRGIIQRNLARRLHPAIAILMTAALFGLAHAGGGIHWVIAAFVAGLGYGAAYQLSGMRLTAPIIAHLLLNMLHLALFSYPNKT